MARNPDETPTQYGLPPQEPPPSQPGSYEPTIPPAPYSTIPSEGSIPPSGEQPWQQPWSSQRADYQAAPEGMPAPESQENAPLSAPASQPPYQSGYYQPAASAPENTAAPTPTPAFNQQTSGRGPSSPAQSGMAGAAGTWAALTQQKPWEDLSLLGQAAGIGGLLLLIFFFCPWMFSPAFAATNPLGIRSFPTASHSGWSVANGVPIFDASTSLALFPQLWLVPLCALGLIVVGVMLRMARLNIRQASVLIVALSFAALLVEFFFLIQVNSIEDAFSMSQAGILSRQAAYGVSWGFWLAVIATIATLGIGLFLLLQEYGLTKRIGPGAPTQRGRPDEQVRPTA